MKKIKLVAVILIVLVLTIGVACSKAPTGAVASESSVLSVSGTGSVVIKPDTAIISIGVKTSNVDVEAAQNENSTQIQAVIDTLVNSGVKKDDITTSNYSVYPIYDYNGEKRTLISYEVNNTLSVKVKDIGKTGQVLSSVVASGVNDINSINFTSSNTDDAYLEALDLAYKDAEEKAVSMAKSAGIDLDGIKLISEGSSYSVDYRAKGASDMAFMMESSVPIETGTLEVSANVSVSYNLK